MTRNEQKTQQKINELYLEHDWAYSIEEKQECLKKIQKLKKNLARNRARRDRDQAYRDCGLTKVRGLLGGTYWE